MTQCFENSILHTDTFGCTRDLQLTLNIDRKTGREGGRVRRLRARATSASFAMRRSRISGVDHRALRGAERSGITEVVHLTPIIPDGRYDMLALPLLRGRSRLG